MRKRYMYSMNHETSTLSDVGRLFPVCRQEVMPGDTWSGRVGGLIRLSPLKRALLQNLFVDVFFFYVPHRLVYADWENFIAEGPVDSPTYTIPNTSMGAGSKEFRALWQNSNGVSGTVYSLLPLYAYNLIHNEFFRDDNDPVRAPNDLIGEYGVTVNHKKDYWTVINDSLGFDQDEQFFDTNVGSGTQASAQDVLDAIARQKIQLKRATYGTRYIDILRSYGINVNYQMLQRPEVVAIGRGQVNATDVVATDSTGLGDLAGHGISGVRVNIRRKTFPEHGQLFGVAVVRPSSLNKNYGDWFDKPRTYDSFYDPQLCTLPHVAVKQEDVTPSADAAQRSNVVGYQPWGDWYRRALSRVHVDLEEGFWVGASQGPLSSNANAQDYREFPTVTDQLFSDVTFRQLQCKFQNRLRVRRLIPKSNISLTAHVNSLG